MRMSSKVQDHLRDPAATPKQTSLLPSTAMNRGVTKKGGERSVKLRYCLEFVWALQEEKIGSEQPGSGVQLRSNPAQSTIPKKNPKQLLNTTTTIPRHGVVAPPVLDTIPPCHCEEADTAS